MHAVDPATGFTITVTDWLPGLSLDPDHALAGMVRQLTGSNSAGYVSYGTEAGIYQEAGIASIVCGPGDIAQAHTADEWIAASQLASVRRLPRAAGEPAGRMTRRPPRDAAAVRRSRSRRRTSRPGWPATPACRASPPWSPAVRARTLPSRR